MKKFYLSMCLLISAVGFAQFPLAESFLLNTDGQLAEYEVYDPFPTIVEHTIDDSVNCTRVCYDDDYVYVRTNGLTDYIMGPWAMNPNEPLAIVKQYRITRNPTEETGTKVANPVVGAMGIGINGVSLYGLGDARSYNSSTGDNDAAGDGLWNGDAWYSEGATMDATGGGHPDGMGNYHYHAVPFALYDDPSSDHSPIIGWAFDGFPIYGPFGYDNPMDDASPIVRIQSSYQHRSISVRNILPDGSTSTPPGPAVDATFPIGTYWEDNEYVDGLGHLDTFNGRFCVTPEFPSGIYAYFVTTDASGDPKFPYMVGPEYYGEVNTMEIGGPAGNISFPSSGLTCLPESGPGAIEENTIDISVYPNPATNSISIEGIQGQSFRIVDLLGKTVLSGDFAEEVDISVLQPGQYIIRIESDEVFGQSRFIKE